METTKIQFQDHRITLESQLDKNFGSQIAKNAHGETLFGCIQCGNCSASCPVSNYMDFTPRKVIAMVRAGFKKQVLSNKTVWLCASCYNCTVECPKGIKITEIMYALKREAIINKIYPKGFSIPILARTFFNEVKNKGRMNETSLLLNYYLKYNIFKSLSYLPLGIKLFRTGRIILFEKGIKDKNSLNKILENK